MTESPPSLRGPRNGAQPRSPMLRRIEGDPRFSIRRALLIVLAAAVAGGVGAVVAVKTGLFAGASSGPSSGVMCLPGENPLDCLDRLNEAETGELHPAILPGLDTDGCSLLSKADQLRSPLCCPGVSPSPADCPQAVQGMGLSVLDGKVVIIDADTPVPGVAPGSAK
jgi:hypothetical protein